MVSIPLLKACFFFVIEEKLLNLFFRNKINPNVQMETYAKRLCTRIKDSAKNLHLLLNNKVKYSLQHFKISRRKLPSKKNDANIQNITKYITRLIINML